MSEPTLRDVAAGAGVNPATASRALREETRHLVNARTVQRVLDAAAALGYRPNPMARSLKTNKSMSVGVIIPDLTNPLFPPIVRGIEEVLAPAGYTSLVVNTDNDPGHESVVVESLRARLVDGFIFATARVEHPLIERLAAHVPLVLVNRVLGDVRLPSVVGDEQAGITAALQHLAALGHQRIGHLAGPQWTSTGQTRLRAFRTGMTALGLDPSAVVQCTNWQEAEGARALAALLADHPEVTAVVAGNDLIALGCYDHLAAVGATCPTDVSIVGFNDMPFVDKVRPALTTVALPLHEIGAAGARLLLERIVDPTGPIRELLLAPTLKVRASTGPLHEAANHPAIRGTLPHPTRLRAVEP